MWVGPGGFIGNFAFRFSKKQKFSSLRLSLSLLTSRIVVLLFTRNRLLTVGPFLFVSVFSADAVRKLRFYDQFKKKDRKHGRITFSFPVALEKHEGERAERSGLLPHLIYYC